ncbi:phage minor head protein [Rhizobium rhizogenes]|uniref:phage head morphogenesis protein n=1 Tax=Rhizobium rhizogenes TaxID=359 RepID=UPI0022C15E38|nr:phage minor head protein [Rhizobium rhizogenes]MCZ7488188.1 minor capsid protein [Rhizobium rhizogenes]
MLRYSMSKLGRRAGRQAGTSTSLPTIEPRLSTEKEYYSALRSMLSQIATETRESIIPLYQAERQQKRAQGTLLADADLSWFGRVQMLAVALARNASNTVNRILDLEAQRHTSTFIETARRALGVNLATVVQQEDLADYLTTAAARNVSLISGLADDTIKRIQQTVYQNSIAGNSVTTLRKALVQDFAVSDRRAKLIARDQTAKLNSDLNRIRQEQAGVTSYKWTTSHDERVRERHRQLDGKTYKWGQATGAEGGLPPGQPVNCRCVARGVIEF